MFQRKFWVISLDGGRPERDGPISETKPISNPMLGKSIVLGRRKLGRTVVEFKGRFLRSSEEKKEGAKLSLKKNHGCFWVFTHYCMYIVTATNTQWAIAQENMSVMGSCPGRPLYDVYRRRRRGLLIRTRFSHVIRGEESTRKNTSSNKYAHTRRRRVVKKWSVQ